MAKMLKVDWTNRSFCGEVASQKIGETVGCMGWVDTIRDHGHILFIHIRDVSGIVQIVFDPEISQNAYDLAQHLRNECVISISGTIRERSEETKNPKLATGNIEITVENLEMITLAETPPFMITEKEMTEASIEPIHVDEEIRLQYRFLDLRRPSMQSNIVNRAKLVRIIRTYLEDQRFVEVETPILTKSTPEGARDYLVPSRVHDNKFYALPQSPQLFKQLLMVSGLDRYYQIARCFRDEDLRPNRQPEFTQVDIEASFINEEFIYKVIEGLLGQLFTFIGVTLPYPFTRMTYDEAMNRYGSDRPDLRFELKMIDATDIFATTTYKIFQNIVKAGGKIKGINLPGAASKLSKNELQNEYAKDTIVKMGGKGLTWMKVLDGKLESNIVQFFSEAEQAEIIARMDGNNDDVLIFVADQNQTLVNEVLGKFRLFIAQRLGLIPQGIFVPLWVTDFPLFELDKTGHLGSTHHPFTEPNIDVLSIDKSDKKSLLAIRARAYDVVMNGEELGGGSIRIHHPDVQNKIFEILGLTQSEIDEKFGFFVHAFRYGTPPHGGVALGLDRLVSMILNTSSIREVIAFPKNRMAFCPMTKAPSNVTEDQLRDLSLQHKIFK